MVSGIQQNGSNGSSSHLNDGQHSVPLARAPSGHQRGVSSTMFVAHGPVITGASQSISDYRKRKVALLTGITGQDGSYLTELLLEKGYEVHGIIRRSSSFNTGRIEHLYRDVHERPNMLLHYGDLTDTTNLVYVISQVRPTEIYNLAAQSHVKVSFDMAEYTGDVDGLGTLRLLDAIRTCGLTNHIRFYQASTSELYGKVQEVPQSETTPFYPRSPYGVAKLYGFWIVKNYRESYGMHASNGILFNHESPRRGRTFVTRKITRAVAEISLGMQECLYLGNLDALRDWGHARDYVEGMWRMLQQETADDYVLATGEMHSVREFVEKSFAHVGITIKWEGKDENEVGKDSQTGKIIVRVDSQYFRPAEVEQLLGNPNKAQKQLGWRREVDFDSLVQEMVEADVAGIEYNPIQQLLIIHNPCLERERELPSISSSDWAELSEDEKRNIMPFSPLIKPETNKLHRHRHHAASKIGLFGLRSAAASRSKIDVSSSRSSIDGSEGAAPSMRVYKPA
ncbi:hypothetical protein EMMF5_004265 [Cystobasidiomycetes sp. EMM_F5]